MPGPLSLLANSERIQRTDGRAEVLAGQMQIDRRLFQIAMTEQDLDSAQVSAGF